MEQTPLNTPQENSQPPKKPISPIIRVLALVGAVLLLISSMYPFYRSFL